MKKGLFTCSLPAFYLQLTCLLLLLHCLLTPIVATAQTKSADDSLKYKIAQMLLVGFRGNELKPGMPIYNDIKKLNIGGVILFDYDNPTKVRRRNITSPTQLKKMVADLQKLGNGNLLISIDQEGGNVNRLRPAAGFPPTVTAKYQGQINNSDTTAKYAAATAKLLHDLGFNLNFAPDTDVDVNPDCPIIGKYGRSFSTDPAVVVANARIWIDEQRKAGVISCIKHFPGHGSSLDDTHKGIVDITRTWSDMELEPFGILIAEGKVDMVMTSHVFNAKLDKQYPATLSKKIITGILRENLGFKGVVVTDDLAMDAMVKYYSFDDVLVKAIDAGADLLCLSNNGRDTYDANVAQRAVESIYKAVKAGKITPARIDESYRRLQLLKQQITNYELKITDISAK